MADMNEVEYLAAIKRLGERSEYAGLDVPWWKLVVLISIVQLCLKHPQLPKGIGEVGKKLAESFIDYIGQSEPALADWLRDNFAPNQPVQMVDVCEHCANEDDPPNPPLESKA